MSFLIGDPLTADLSALEAVIAAQASTSLTSGNSSDNRVLLAATLESAILSFCVAPPDSSSSDSILSYFLSAFPQTVASHPHTFVQPVFAPLDSSLAISLFGIHRRVNEMKRAARVGSQARFRILVLAIERTIGGLDDRGRQECAAVKEVLDRAVAMPFMDDWEADLDVNDPEGGERQHQWLYAGDWDEAPETELEPEW
jgi:hypothetical protein